MRPFHYMIAALALGLSHTALADTPAPQTPRVGIGAVDFARIANESKAFKDAQKALEEKNRALENDFSKKDQELAKESGKLNALKTSLAPEEFNKRKKALEKKFSNFQTEVIEKKKEFENAFENLILSFQKKVQSILEASIEKKGIAFVVDLRFIVAGTKNIPNLTDEVIETLNKETGKTVSPQ